MNAPLITKEMKMKFNYQEDYSGANLDHRIVGETRTISSDIDRIVTPEYGSFFFATLSILNVDTGRKLVANKDYIGIQLDVVASELSGKACHQAFQIKNKQVVNIRYEYIFVGGKHMSGLHLINELKKIYPNGLVPTHHFDRVLNKPDTYPAKPHLMNIKSLYGFDGASSALDRIINAMGFSEARAINQTFNRVVSRLDVLDQELNDYIATAENAVNTAFEDFRVQDSEYIFTDSAANPAIARGYGNWVLVKDTVLKGDNLSNSYIVGSDSVIALGSKQYAKNVYLWKNQITNKRPTYQITCPTHAGLTSSQRYENQDIVFNIQTTNLVAGTKLSWMMIDEQTQQPVTQKLLNTPTGEVVVDATGRASVTLKFKPDTNSVNADRSYSFRLLRSVEAKFKFALIDSSLQKRIALKFTQDIAGNYPLSSVPEGEDFYLHVQYVGNWVQGETALLDWFYGSVDPSRINGIPWILTVPTSPKEVFKLKIKADELSDARQTVVVYALIDADDLVSSSTAYATIDIKDSSQLAYANVTFNDVSLNRNNIASINEDSNFDIVINTNQPNTKLTLVYESTKSIDDFSGLNSNITTNAAGVATIRAKTLADFLTNIGAQSLTVSVEMGQYTLGKGTLFISDTSQSPVYELFFTNSNGTRITEIPEADRFFVNVRVPNWRVTDRPPNLIFAYRLDGNVNTTNEDLSVKLAGNFYDAMVFGPAAATYNGVSWVNGDTLRFEFTTLADKLVTGDKKFTVLVRQSNQSIFGLQSDLWLRDTSIPTITATWSSSPTVLTPLTSVNEMTANGLNQRFYLWLDVEGDGASFGTITLNSNSVNGEDLVTVFPRTFKMAAGTSRQILTLDAKADFILEGDKEIYISGTYKGAGGRDVELFRPTINLVDNSAITALDTSMSTSASTVVPADTFSEWVPFYAHLSYPAFAFDTQIEWRIVFTSNPSGNEQLLNTEGVIEVVRNTSKSVLTITPIKDRMQDGEARFTLYCRRKVKATGQYITHEQSIPNLLLLDDSLPTALGFKVYSDAARTQEIGSSVDEGKTVYLRATLANPDRNYAVSFGIGDNVNRQGIVAGQNANFLTSENVPARLVINDRKVVKLISGTSGANSTVIDAEAIVVADRVTNPNSIPFALNLIARAYDNSSGAYPLNAVPEFGDMGLIHTRSKEFLINDTSKTASYKGVYPVSVNEDADFVLTLEITNGTVGDVYYPTMLNGFDVSRFSINEIGLEQLSATANDILRWKFKVRPDFKTTGAIPLSFGIMNKTTAQSVAKMDLTLNDTSLEPSLLATVGNGEIITEGDANAVLTITSSNNQLQVGNKVIIEYVSGRAKSAFPLNTWGEKTIVAGAPNKVVVPINLAKDRTTNSGAENVITIKVTDVASGTVKNFSFNINDVSQTPAIRSVVWKDQTGKVISEAREGDKVRMEVLTNGGTDPYNITLTNNGGRSPSRLNSSDYGVTRTRVDDQTAVVWNFDIKVDNTNNVGAETMLRVRLLADAGNVDMTYTLPIYDNSRSTTGRVEFNANNSTDVITSIAEGSAFGIKYVVTDPDPEGVYRLLTTSSRTNDGWMVDNNIPIDQFYSFGSDRYTYKMQRETSFNETLNIPAQLLVNAELWDVNNNRLLASASLNLIDVSRPTIPSSSIRITTPAGTAHLSNINEGTTAEIYILPSAFNGVDWSKETMYVSLDSNFSLKGGFTIAGTNLLQDGSYRASFSIPADETTATGQQIISASLYNKFNGLTNSYLRGSSANTIVNDTSPQPFIESVFYCNKATIEETGAVAVEKLNEGDSFYALVYAYALNATGADEIIKLDWSGTLSNADLDKPLPTTMTLKRFDVAGNRYRGSVGPFRLLEDDVDG